MKAKRRWINAGIVAGVLLMLSPLVGVIFSMTRAFNTLDSSGIAKPEELAESIGSTLMFTASGVIIFPIGLVIFVISLVFFFQLRAANPPPLPPQSPSDDRGS